MRSDRHLDLVRLTPEERAEFFARLEGGGDGVPLHRNRRCEPRWAFRSPDVLISFERAGGGAPFFRVLARNISASGLAFIHGGYVHLGTRCNGLLRDLQGESVPVAGQVVGCRHVEGALHEVRIRLDTPIAPDRFIEPETLDGPTLDEDALAAIAGRVLYVQVSDVDGTLMRHQLGPTRVELDPTSSVDDAIESVRQAPPDAVLLELDRTTEDGITAIARLREAGYAGPLVAISADTNPDRLSSATSSGADRLLAKPFDPQGLFTLLQEVLSPAEGSATVDEGLPSEDVVYSTLDADEGLKEMLLQFIDHAESMSSSLEHALDEQNLEQARAACVHLKGSASGHGFSPLGDAAAAALDIIDQTKSIEDSTTKVRALSAMCKRLGVRGQG